MLTSQFESANDIIIGQSNSISLNYPYLLGRPRTSNKIEISLRHGQQSDAPGDELVVESQRSLLSLSKGTKVLRRKQSDKGKEGFFCRKSRMRKFKF